MKSYQVLLLKDQGRSSNQRLSTFLLCDLKEWVEASGGVVFGVFGGLLGLATNEAYLVFSAEQPLDFRHEFEQAGYQVKQSIQLNATVRPLEHLPASRQGVYVFRWFDVISRDVEEIVALSAAAWPSFEADFDTQIQGLFAEPSAVEGNNSTNQCKMLLITWYKNLSVWQASRMPSQEARDNFMRRHALTLEAKPIATSLLLSEG